MNDEPKTALPYRPEEAPTPSGRWLVPPADLATVTINGATQSQTPSTKNGPRYRLGWSLAIAAPANVALGMAAIAFNATTVGVVACATLGVASWLLVMAEALCRYTAETRPDLETIERASDHRYRTDWRDDGW